jgi:hypothetical protein
MHATTQKQETKFNLTWTKLVDRVGSAFRMEEEEKRRLENNKTAKLISAIPFFAGCEHPERTAASHLGTYLMARDEHTKSIFRHHPDDDNDIYRRLRPIGNFHGGDPDIIQRGMALVALIMTSDHNIDGEADKQAEKYNPVNSGKWDFDELREELSAVVLQTPCPEMDKIVTAGEGSESWWDDYEKSGKTV